MNPSEQLPSNESAAADNKGAEPGVLLEQWQALDAIWKAILGMEVSIDSLRLNMDSLRAEMEAAFKKPLSVEEKVHALQADVAQSLNKRTPLSFQWLYP